MTSASLYLAMAERSAFAARIQPLVAKCPAGHVAQVRVRYPRPERPL